ncbi:unnamed protein product [Mycena citricolor]|uniref:Zn(2)-C6 fungal-type domain-containing protein n=1 Tax=Mycena citricolor TaxID=2018698 RepID=A0AAD2JX28_9AGAR|nr:unnamed protein product [Mycena citricolor]
MDEFQISKRVIIACTNCRDRKTKCLSESKEKICTGCARLGLECVYLPVKKHPSRPNSQARSQAHSPTASESSSTAAQYPSGYAQSYHSQSSHVNQTPAYDTTVGTQMNLGHYPTGNMSSAHAPAQSQGWSSHSPMSYNTGSATTYGYGAASHAAPSNAQFPATAQTGSFSQYQ